MPPQDTPNTVPLVAASAFTARDVAEILRENGWLPGDATSAQVSWCERAAVLLGPHVADRNSLADLLQLIFHYDAREILAKVESHSALSRSGAREVLRHLALLLLDGAPLTTDRFKEVVNTLKETLGLRSRELFHPIRLAIAGRVGEGDLDRIILLLDEAVALNFAVPVKSARERILEFCAALD
jgi:nondiscriminating glutamyl-tRNA synthetase